MSGWLSALPAGDVVAEESYPETLATGLFLMTLIRRKRTKRRTEYRGVTLDCARANDTPVIMPDGSQTLFDIREIVAGGYILTKIEDVPTSDWVVINGPPENP